MALLLKNPRFAVDEGYPYIAIEINGQKAKIPLEQKLFEKGALFVGAEFEDSLSFALPANSDDGRPRAQKFAGFTDDSRLLALYRQFTKELSDGTFSPRRVSLP